MAESLVELRAFLPLQPGFEEPARVRQNPKMTFVPAIPSGSEGAPTVRSAANTRRSRPMPVPDTLGIPG
jgi:hypothetical protein